MKSTGPIINLGTEQVQRVAWVRSNKVVYLKVRRLATGSKSQIMTVLSLEPETRRRPSGDHLQYHTSSQCSFSTWGHKYSMLSRDSSTTPVHDTCYSLFLGLRRYSLKGNPQKKKFPFGLVLLIKTTPLSLFLGQLGKPLYGASCPLWG